MSSKPTARPPQHQDQPPGLEAAPPESIQANYHGSSKLYGKVGEDLGVSRAVALHFAREGAW